MTDRAQGIKWLSEAIAEIARLYEARQMPSNANRALIQGLVRRSVAAIFADGSPERDAYDEFKLGSVGLAFARDPRVAMRQVLGNAKNDLDGLVRKAELLLAEGETAIPVQPAERTVMTRPEGTAGFQATVYRVLIASPGDAALDRDTVRQAIHDWNDVHAVPQKAVLLPVMWETHSTPKLGGRPQGILNEQFVDDVDLVLAVFRTRIGQPTGEAESGTLEEIERCLAVGKHVGAYFSNEAVAIGTLDGDQLQKLATFKQSVKKHGILGDYETQPELRRKITADLAKLVYRMSEPRVGEHRASAGQRAPDEDAPDEGADYLARLERLVDELLLAWETERDGSSNRIENGKAIMSTLKSELQYILVEYKRDIPRPVASKLKEHINTAKQLEDLLLTTGNWITFWSLGSVLLSYLGALSRGESEVRLQNGAFEFAWDIAGADRPRWSRGDSGAPSVMATLRVKNVSDRPETVVKWWVTQFIAQHAFLKDGSWTGGECEIQPGQEVTFRLISPCEAVRQGKEEIHLPVAFSLASGQGPNQGVWFAWTDSFTPVGA